MVNPPPEWLKKYQKEHPEDKRRIAWRLRKKLYGKRDASIGFNDFLAQILTKKMNMERFAP